MAEHMSLMSKKCTTLNGFLGDRMRKRTVDQNECDDELSSKQPRVIFEESNYAFTNIK